MTARAVESGLVERRREGDSARETASPRGEARSGLLALQRTAGNQAALAALRMAAPRRTVMRCSGCGGTCRAAHPDDELLAEGFGRLRGAVAARGIARSPQRTLARASTITSPRFLNEPLLEDCFENKARMGIGASDTATNQPVSKVQQALLDWGVTKGVTVDLGSTGPAGNGVDGVYGSKTAKAIKLFKATEHLGLEQFGDVGPRTMERLNDLFPPAGPTPTPPPPTPPALPPEPARVCGPNVTSEVASAWRSAETAFDALPFFQKLDNCRMLVQPVVHDASGFHLNEDAFDTWGLFQNSASWTRIPPWHGSCNTPGSSGNHCRSRDPLHEATDVCSNTVQIGSDCWLTGTPNYGLFGVAMRRCHDFVSPLGFLPPPFNFAPETFGLANTMILAGAYKALKGDNVVGPERWVSATWLGGPSATASAAGIPETGGARPRCSTTCPGPAPPTFSIVWEPHMPRTAAPKGPPYLPGPPACPAP